MKRSPLSTRPRAGPACALALALALVLVLAVVRPTCGQARARLTSSNNNRNSSSSSSSNNNNNNNSNTNNNSGSSADRGALRERSLAQAASNRTGGRLESFAEDELPPDFYEMPPEQLDLGMNATGRAPTPVLNVAVLQNGQVIDSAITVHPGTPLEMLIYLDDKSAEVYGLLASYLKVQDDTFRQREETIILNGCSLDTYIFGNFEHNAEDKYLRAKFRAFKFPDSNFVRFIGTVNVCIKQCAKVNCGGGGSSSSAARRKRAASDRLVQLTVSTVLRISNERPKLSR